MQGLLLLNKPKGITSFSAVAKIKKVANERRVGHTGTLDPMASGVLPIFIGRATALSQYLLDADKRYTAKIKLGVVTDTADITGTVLAETQVSVDDGLIEQTLKTFLGKQMQTPPMYSAIKKDGVRLYSLAREGKTVEIEPREITVHSIEKTSDLNRDNEFCIDVLVSKGTYIRSLCTDIGKALGCGATLSGLIRTQTAGFNLADCVDLDDITPENIGEFLRPSDSAVGYMKKLSVTEKQGVRFSNGGQLYLDRLKGEKLEDNETCRVYCGETFLGIGRADFSKNWLCIGCLVQQIKNGG